MKIVLINAALPDYPWKKHYTPSSFAEAQKEYEAAALPEGTVSQAKLAGYRIWHASSFHARQTAEKMIGTGTGIPCTETELLDEIPPVPFSGEEKERTFRKYSWTEFLRWKRNDPALPEGRTESEKKGNELLDLLEESGEDAVLISHERRILLLLELLRRRKYQLRRGSVIRLAPMERILAAKQILTCGGCMHNCQLINPGCAIGQDKAKRYGVNRRQQ